MTQLPELSFPAELGCTPEKRERPAALPTIDSKAARILETIVSASQSHLAFVRRNMTWAYVNASAAKALGKSAEDLIGRPISESIANEHPRPLEQSLGFVFHTGSATECDSLMKFYGNATPRWMRIAIIPHLDDDGEISGAIVRARDIHDEIVARSTAFTQNELIQRHLDAGQLAFVQMDTHSRVERWSKAAEMIFGWSGEQAIGKKATELCMVHTQDVARVREAFQQLRDRDTPDRVHIRCRNRTKDGSFVWCDWYASAVSAPEFGLHSILCFAVDVTESVEAKEALTRAARFDPLTLLPNRYALYESLGEKLQNPQVTGHTLFVDLDGFKEINDRYGHKTGDYLLKLVAARLERLVGPDDLCARYGGDEFALFISARLDAPSVTVVAEKIISELRHPFQVDTLEVELSCSVGIAPLVSGLTDPQVLISHADLAMYAAKENGRDQFTLYTDEMGERANARVGLHTGLREAMRLGHINVDFQPRLDTTTLKIIGAEALARWRRPNGTSVSPNDFIPVAEETGLIHDLGAFVLQQACEFAHAVNTAARKDDRNAFVVSVNLSTVQLRQPQFVKRAKAIFASARCLPHWIEFEVTESRELTDPSCVDRLNELVKRFGARCALDDFGTGYSNIVELTNLPLTVMKIDRSIVNKLAPSNTSLVAAVLALATSLGLEAVAEGVETAEQLAQLRALGCKSFQGFLHSAPMPRAVLQGRIDT